MGRKRKKPHDYGGSCVYADRLLEYNDGNRAKEMLTHDGATNAIDNFVLALRQYKSLRADFLNSISMFVRASLKEYKYLRHKKLKTSAYMTTYLTNSAVNEGVYNFMSQFISDTVIDENGKLIPLEEKEVYIGNTKDSKDKES